MSGAAGFEDSPEARTCARSWPQGALWLDRSHHTCHTLCSSCYSFRPRRRSHSNVPPSLPRRYHWQTTCLLCLSTSSPLPGSTIACHNQPCNEFEAVGPLLHSLRLMLC